MNVKEGFGECSPFPSLGITALSDGKTSMQVYLKDEGIF